MAKARNQVIGGEYKGSLVFVMMGGGKRYGSINFNRFI